MNSLKGVKISKRRKQLELDIKNQLEDISSNETVQLADELIEVISKREDLTYQEVYQALELSYSVVESQSVFASVSPINVHFDSLKSKQE